MAVFYHKASGAYAFVSLKAGYTTFVNSNHWSNCGNWPSVRMLLGAIVSTRPMGAYQVVRHPESRVISFFVDKFRNVPKVAVGESFEWQACLRLFFPYLGIQQGLAPTEEVARVIAAFPFDEFVHILPKIFRLDPHLTPQWWTPYSRIGQSKLVKWPNLQIIRMEDGIETLSQIPDIDFSVKLNATHHLERDFDVKPEHRTIIASLYKQDYGLGGYKVEEG